jgi:hypothetical protein
MCRCLQVACSALLLTAPLCAMPGLGRSLGKAWDLQQMGCDAVNLLLKSRRFEMADRILQPSSRGAGSAEKSAY